MNTDALTRTGPTVSITDGLQPRKATAADFGVTERTIIRWEIAGMPVIRIGKQRWHDRNAVRDWIDRQQVNRHQPNRPGRPSSK